MSDFDQKDNGFLAMENTKLSILDQKLSVAILENQRVNPFSFLILIKRPLKVIHADADAPPQRRRSGGVGNFVRASKGPDLISRTPRNA